jgi:hypothetical protein
VIKLTAGVVQCVGVNEGSPTPLHA